MKRRDLLKGLLAAPFALLVAKCSPPIRTYTLVMDGFPQGGSLLTLPKDTTELRFEVVSLKCKPLLGKIYTPKDCPEYPH